MRNQRWQKKEKKYAQKKLLSTHHSLICLCARSSCWKKEITMVDLKKVENDSIRYAFFCSA
jgi:hypothetical protein